MKAFLKALEISSDSEMNVKLKDKRLIKNATNNARSKDWAQGFKDMAANSDDQLVIPDVFNDEDNTDWKW